MTQEALKLALECAERCEAIDGMYSWSATITAIEETLAQTQEPDYWLGYGLQAHTEKPFESATPLYTHPPKRTEQEPVAWRDHVEQRLLTWRQSFVNKSGDQLALDDFMDKQSLDDLIDFVCDEYTTPPQRKPLTDEQEREAFEAHWYSFYHSGSIHARSDGSYFHPHVQRAWEAWQARAAQE